MNNWELVEEWECPECGNNDIYDEIVYCRTCERLRNNEPVNLNLSFSSDVSLPRGIMFYSYPVSSVLKRKIIQKHWGDYEFLFYPKEFLPPKGKSLELLHIHVISKKGDIRVFLDDFRVEEVKGSKGGIPSNEWDAISEFVKENYNDITIRVEISLRKAGIIK